MLSPSILPRASRSAGYAFYFWAPTPGRVRA